MKQVKQLTLSAAVLAALVSGTASADLTGNVGATSNYMWRGTTQTGGGSSVSGGIDYSHDSGLYAGIWTANTAFGSPETDFYVGFGGEAGGVGYDISVIQYSYLQTDNLDWVEVNASASMADFTLAVGITSDVFGTDTSATYVSGEYEMAVGKESSLTLHVGSYSFDDEAAAAFDNYVDYGLTLTKGDWSFAYSDTNLDADIFTDGDPVFFVSWGTEVDL